MGWCLCEAQAMPEASSAKPRDLAVAEFWASSGTQPHRELGLPQQSFLPRDGEHTLNSRAYPLHCRHLPLAKQ
jgi:hypothetical protein